MASSNPNIPSQNYENFDSLSSLSPLELARLRELLNDDDEADSNYTEYAETTHAWAVFADNPEKRATKFDRLVGTIIIIFQLFTYYLFARYVQPHATWCTFICGGLLFLLWIVWPISLKLYTSLVKQLKTINLPPCQVRPC